MNRYDRYYDIADVLEHRLPQKIKEFFPVVKNDGRMSREMDREISGWLALAQDNSDHDGEFGYDLRGLIMYLISTSEKETGLKEDRVKYREARRYRKIYLKKAILKESKDPAKGKNLSLAWEEYKRYMGSPMYPSKVYESEKVFYEEKVKDVVDWADNSASQLIEYPFYALSTPKQKYRDYVNDVAFHTFDILTELYGDELPATASDGGNIIKTPEFISGRGVFGATSSIEELETEVGAEEAFSYSERTIINDDNNEIFVKSVIDKVRGDFKDATSDEDKNGIIASLVESGQMKLQNSGLDSTDMELFTHIFSSFSVEDVAEGKKEFKLKSLMRALYTEAKEERKVSLVERLDRLGSYSAEYTVRSSSSGKILEAGNISFFDVSYKIASADEEGEDYVYSAALRRMDGSQSSFLNEINEYKADDISVVIGLSTPVRDARVHSMNTVIFEEMYKRIPTSKAKSMLMFLQSKRTAIYPETSLDISVSFLAQNFRLEKQKRSRQVKCLLEMIEPLKEAGVLVKDYYVDKSLVHIDFLPFSSTELSAYHIGSARIGKEQTGA
jgi:hypothetical protein